MIEQARLFNRTKALYASVMSICVTTIQHKWTLIKESISLQKHKTFEILNAPVKYKYPSVERSVNLTPNLEELEPMVREGQKDANRIEFDTRQPLPDFVFGMMDGYRLFYISLGSSRNIENSYVIYFYIFGIIGLAIFFMVMAADRPRVEHLWLSGVTSLLLIYAIIATIIKRKLPVDQFIVFDRERGNVLFTGRKGWPDLVVPFARVGMYTEHAVGHGALHFIAKFDCQMRPKGKRGRRTDMVAPLGVSNEVEAIKHWAYINRFMDKSKPLPTWAAIQWFAERNLTIEYMMQRDGYLEEDPKASWFKWDNTAPLHQVRPEEMDA